MCVGPRGHHILHIKKSDKEESGWYLMTSFDVIKWWNNEASLPNHNGSYYEPGYFSFMAYKHFCQIPSYYHHLKTFSLMREIPTLSIQPCQCANFPHCHSYKFRTQNSESTFPVPWQLGCKHDPASGSHLTVYTQDSIFASANGSLCVQLSRVAELQGQVLDAKVAWVLGE